MEYKQKKYSDWWSGKARSDTYRGTITDKNDPEFLLMKSDLNERNNTHKRRMIERIEKGYMGHGEELIKRINASFDFKGLERFKICGRGPRRDSNGNRLYPNVDSHLRHADSTHFDIYVIRNYDAEYNFIQFAKKEFTPEIYEQEMIEAEISRLEYKLMALKHGWQS